MAQIQDSWDIACAIDVTFLALAFFSCLFRFVSWLKNGDDKNLADHLMVLAFVRGFVQSFSTVALTCTGFRCCVVHSSYLASVL